MKKVEKISKIDADAILYFIVMILIILLFL